MMSTKTTKSYSTKSCRHSQPFMQQPFLIISDVDGWIFMSELSYW